MYNKDQEKLIEAIFALFIGINANVCQPNNASFIQAKPIEKGTWYYQSIKVKTITFYYTTKKIMVQGSGIQKVRKHNADNYFTACKEVVDSICKLNMQEVNEIGLGNLGAAAEFFDSIHAKQELMFTAEELHDEESNLKRSNNWKYGSLEGLI